MSGFPFDSQIFGVNGNLPGWSVNGATNQGMGVSGPNASYLDWNAAAQSDTSASNWANNGLPPPTSGAIGLISNDFIQTHHVTHPWKDGSHMHIAEYQIVAVGRGKGNANFEDLYNVISLARLNELMREAYAVFQEAVAGGNPEAVKFQRFLTEYGENELEDYYINVKKRGIPLDAYTEDPKAQVELKDFYDLSQDRIYRYLTKLGILLAWNVLGVTIGVNRGTGLDEVDMQQAEQHVSVVNTVIGKRAFTHNVFAGERSKTVTGADAYLVLRRNNKRQFEWVALAQRDQLQLSDTETTYEADGRLYDAHVQPLGVITTPPARDTPPGIKEMSLALNSFGNGKLAYEAVASLPTMTIQVGM